MKLLPTTDPKAINDRAAHAAGLPAVVDKGNTDAISNAIFPVFHSEDGDKALLVNKDSERYLTAEERGKVIDTDKIKDVSKDLMGETDLVRRLVASVKKTESVRDER